MLYLAGPHGSGKTTARELLEENGFFGIELGDIVRGIYAKSSSPLNFVEWSIRIEQEKGRDYIDNQIVDSLNRALNRSDEYIDAVVSGCRSTGIITRINVDLNPKRFYGLPQKIIYIDAPHEALFSRYQNRKRVTQDEFSKMLNIDEKLGLESLKKVADVFIINDGNIGQFRKKVIEVVWPFYGDRMLAGE